MQNRNDIIEFNYFEATKCWIEANKNNFAKQFVVEQIKYLGPKKMVWGITNEKKRSAGSYELLIDGTVDIAIFNIDNMSVLFTETTYCKNKSALFESLDQFLSQLK